MNHNENKHPVLKEPPVAHALHYWDAAARVLRYEYNGRDLISIEIPGSDEAGFRHGSDGNIQNIPFFQSIYVALDDCESAMDSLVTITLSADALNMRPNRAGREQAILGQCGRPLMHGVNGMYDILQDLLIEWHGCEWQWHRNKLMLNENGELTAQMRVKLGRKPWTINLKPGYYNKHLGYSYHKPWEFRPNTKPVAGWCSWEAFRREVAASDIADIAKFFGNTLSDYGLEYIQLDDGYEKMPIPYDAEKNLADGWLDTNENFPDGHEGVVDAILEHGFSPAIWTNCNIINVDFVQKHADCFVKDQEGKLLLGEWIDYVFACDENSLSKHILPIYSRLRELGYHYFKIDAIRHLLLDGLHEAVRQGVMSNEDAEQRFRRFMECVRMGIGGDAYFLASWGVLSEVVGVVDACRIAMDANPTWAGIRMQMVESARWFHSQRILFLNDPDHICCRTQTEWLKSVISLVSLSGSLLMLSDPLSVYTPERMEIIKKSLPTLDTYAGETGPMDLSYPAFCWTKLHGFAVTNSEKPVAAEHVELNDAINMAGEYLTMDDNHPFSALWAFHIEKPWKNWCVAGRFATVPLSACQLKFEQLGLHPDKEYLVFDFWKQEYLGNHKGEMQVEALGLGQCQIISLTPVCAHPQLIASSRHVSMDAVSVQNHYWDGERLNLTLNGIKGTTETYWFHIPDGYSHEAGIDNLLKHEITFSKEQEEVILNFTHL